MEMTEEEITALELLWSAYDALPLLKRKPSAKPKRPRPTTNVVDNLEQE